MGKLFATTEVFTTGQVAKLCQVAPRTVSKWFDSGMLKGHRVPGSRDRRFPRAHLRQFLMERELGYALRKLQMMVLVMCLDPAIPKKIQEVLGEEYTVAHSTTPFALALDATDRDAVAFVLDMALGRSQVVEMVQNLRAQTWCAAQVPFLALAVEDDGQPEALLQWGFCQVLKTPRPEEVSIAVKQHVTAYLGGAEE